MSNITVSGTGHRNIAHNEKTIKTIIKRALLMSETNMVLSGGAIGFDTFLAESALELGIPFQMICPFKDQGKNWPAENKKRYDFLLSKAFKIVYTAEEYSRACFFVRDHYLVDNCNILLAFYDGRKFGGTKYTVDYANKKSCKTINLYEVVTAIIDR